MNSVKILLMLSYKNHMVLYSIVLLIGVGCFGVGLGSISAYLTGNPQFSVWYGGVPMAFSTSVVILFVGLALYLIGKSHILPHDGPKG